MSVPIVDDAAFDAYREKVNVYEQTWHTEDTEPQKSFLDAHPGLRNELFTRSVRGQKVSTTDVYAFDGTWHPDRIDSQEALVSDLLAKVPQARATQQSVYFLIGLPGSGKSSALRPLALRHAGLAEAEVAFSDADELRTTIPEYAKGLGSWVVQDECAELMYNRPGKVDDDPGLQGAIVGTSGTVIVDVIGHPDYLPAHIRRLRRQGRRVYVLQASCNTDLCIARAKTRALRRGRLVPPELILAKEGVPEKTLAAVKSTSNPSGWAVVDTTQSPARIVDSHRFKVA
jgi:hypothetical protein